MLTNCINYPKLGFKDKRDAINSCINKKSIAKFGRTARFKEFDNVTALDYPMAYYPWHENGTIMSVQFSVECRKIYHRANCELETSFTKTTTVRESFPHFKFYQSMCEDPSYHIQSHPKIQNVDYVTYIFGAFGTWFGFSFILFNPVKYIFLFRTTFSKTGVLTLVNCWKTIKIQMLLWTLFERGIS